MNGVSQSRARASVRCACSTTGRSTIRPSSRAAPGDAASATRTRWAQSSASALGRSGGVDRLHLAWVDAQLGAEAKPRAHRPGPAAGVLVVELRRDACDRCRQARQARSDRDAAGGIAEAARPSVVMSRSRSSAKSSVPNTRRCAPAAAMRVHFRTHRVRVSIESEDAGVAATRPGSRRSARPTRPWAGARRSPCASPQGRKVCGKPGELASLMRTTMRDRPAGVARCSHPVTTLRAVALSSAATASSRSRTTLSAPLASALSKRSGRVARHEQVGACRRQQFGGHDGDLRRPWMCEARRSRRAVAEFGQDRVRVLAERRHRVHPRAGIPGAGRQHGGHRPHGGPDLGPAPSRLAAADVPRPPSSC